MGTDNEDIHEGYRSIIVSCSSPSPSSRPHPGCSAPPSMSQPLTSHSPLLLSPAHPPDLVSPHLLDLVLSCSCALPAPRRARLPASSMFPCASSTLPVPLINMPIFPARRDGHSISPAHPAQLLIPPSSSMCTCASPRHRILIHTLVPTTHIHPLS